MLMRNIIVENHVSALKMKHYYAKPSELND